MGTSTVGSTVEMVGRMLKQDMMNGEDREAANLGSMVNFKL